MSAAGFRCTLVAGVAAVALGAGFTVLGLTHQADAQTQIPRSASAPLAGSPDDTVSPTVSSESFPPPSVSPPVSASATPRATRRSPGPRRTSAPASTPTATTTPVATDSPVIDQVLAHINAARTAAGLSALTLDAQLSKASELHNQLMIDGCGLQHQCPGESGLGARFTAQGVSWSTAGENIGYSSSGSSDAQIVSAANGLTDSMLAEQPPNDGHRRNLLNTRFKRIGLSVVRDSKGITWMTQDFVG